MPDLKDQIRAYFDEIDPPFAPAELMREPRRTQRPLRIMTARAFPLVAGTAALVLLLIGGPILLLRGTPDGGNQPSSSVDVETTVTTVATTTSTTESAPTTTQDQLPETAPTDLIPDRVLDIAWNQVAIDQDVFGEALLSGVVAFGDLLVAYGEVATGELSDGSETYTVGKAAAWVSDDAELWTSVTASGAVPRDNIVAGGPGMVSISIVDGLPVSWLSSDGVTWAEIPLDREVFADWELCGQTHPPNFDELWSAGPVVIAHHKYLCGPARYPGRVWVTTDGYEWTSLQPAAFGEEWPSGWDTALSGSGNSDNWRLNDVAGVAGAIVAVGEDQGPAIWFSSGGYAWQRTEVELGGFAGYDVRIWAVATSGTGFVAMGSTGGEFTRDVLVWTSPDGQDWSQAPLAIDPSIGEVRELAASNDGYVAFGWNGVLLTSPDGATWQQETTRTPMSDVTISDTDLFGSRLYVTGVPITRDEDGNGRIGPWEPFLFYWESEAS